MKIQIIGNGNVGSHLIKALKSLNPISVNPHTLQEFDPAADITILALKDDVISEVAASLPSTKGLIVHTAGSVGIDALSSHNRRGVLYPLQTFSKSVALDYSKIPVFIEANDDSDKRILEDVASIFTENIFHLDSKQRQKLHIASVFACNFCNHLWAISEDILKNNSLEFSLIKPLISETFRKMESSDSPIECQTGPAARKDMKVINSHIKTLNDSGEERYAEIYRLLSDSIMRNDFSKLDSPSPSNP